MKKLYTLVYMVHIVARKHDDDTEQEIIVRGIHADISTLKDVTLLHTGKPIESLNDVDTYTDENGKTWVLPHSKDFPEFIKKEFGKPMYMSNESNFLDRIIEAKETGVQSSKPFPYQLFVRDYLRYGTPYRSLLLEHGLGSGKTLSAILVAKTFRKAGLKTLILTPAFLRLNFWAELEKWEDDGISLNEWYEFAHYNATGIGPGSKNAGKGGVWEQLAQLGIGFSKDDPEYGDIFPYLHDKYKQHKLEPPKRRLIIIEEAHNLNRSFIADGAKKTRSKLYALLMKAVDCKIICLSGTPMISNPFETATLYNILRGPMSGGHRAFHEQEHQFNTHFIDYTERKIVNESLMMRRMLGLNSYFKGITNDVDRVIFPGRKDIICTPTASPYQTRYHDEIFADESALLGKRRPNLVSIAGDAPNIKMDPEQAALNPPSSYYSMSRASCNFAFPAATPRPRPKVINTREIERYTFRFKMPATGKTPQTADDYQLIYEAIDTDVYFEEGEELDADWAIVLDSGELDSMRQFLSDNIVSAYGGAFEDNKGIPQTFALYDYLSKKDLRIIQKTYGEYKDRMKLALDDLANKFKISVFSMSALPSYSKKMYTIYHKIADDTEHGAPHLVDIDRDPDVSPIVTAVPEILLEDEDPTTMEMEMEIAAEAVPESEAGELVTGKVKVIDDPDDPMLKHKGVYLSDEQLKKMGKRVSGGPALVYSYFSTAEGATIFSMILQAHGFENFSSSAGDPKTMVRKKRYAFFRGGMDKHIKKKILEIFNSKENVNGQLIRVIFATQAAAEGISLFNVRQIHIMEPHWDNNLIEQMIGRGFRLHAHQYIADRDERFITVYRYFTVRPNKDVMEKKYPTHYSEYEDISPHAMMTDHLIQKIADRKDDLRHAIADIRVQAAVDCYLNKDINKPKKGCYKLADTASTATYHANIEDDLRDEESIQEHTVTRAVKFVTLVVREGPKKERRHKYYFYYDGEVSYVRLPNDATKIHKARKLYGPLDSLPPEDQRKDWKPLGGEQMEAGFIGASANSELKKFYATGTITEIPPERIKRQKPSASTSASASSMSTSSSSKTVGRSKARPRPKIKPRERKERKE